MDNKDPPVSGHRMVLAIMEFADGGDADLAREYEASVTTPNMPWQWLEEVRLRLWEGLVRRAHKREIVVRGVLDPIGGAVTITSDVLQGSKPDFVTDTLEAAGATFRAVRVFTGSSMDPTQKSERELQGTPARGTGGVAATYDWDEFVRELTRALFAGELVDRRAVKKHMMAWCSEHWHKQPDEKSVRIILGRYLHRDIPEKSTRNN